ncbi:hypothetical protein [Sphingomonas prati]|uniref:GNAT superfamily N-acetyltransferase n=1 Tax=Sphingomonas prati TaxID=1843237 RepID=A0A7W9BVI2_9SPHN|nr:hypothetical protein [Sphingomonas prati]MBB5730887.1 GNAT superfamily N-acetyltransferase [Sphingomonas prati]GGE97546.1 hypothetical protein GCM10011404_33380 [Sphingomonas prati]
MLIPPEIAALFPSPVERHKTFSWSLFEVGTQPFGCMIAIGTREVVEDGKRRLDVLALDLTERDPYPRQVMIGEAKANASGVTITPGLVEVIHARLRGLGIGTLVFNVVTAWAQRTFPGADLAPITIVRPAGAAEFDRLARFYGRFGLSWDRPANGWCDQFPSKPMTVDALKQYPEELLPDVRRVDLTKGLTAMFDRMLEADDDRRMVVALRDQLADRRDRWRTIGYRLNTFGLGLAALAGFGAARALALL